MALIAVGLGAAAPPPPHTVNTTIAWMGARLRTGRLYRELQRQLSPGACAAAMERGRATSLETAPGEMLGELGRGSSRIT